MYACEQREKAQRDWKSKSLVARDKDMVKGELKGRVEEKKIEIAGNRLNMNMPLKDIPKDTGLLLSEIQSLT